MAVNLGDYFLKKFVFPRVYVLDRPGVIISKTSNLFGKVKSTKRDVYYFESIFRELYNETIKSIGSEKASLMFYKMGKDLGVGYLLLANIGKVSSFLVPVVMRALCSVTWASGMGVSKNISFLKNGKVVLHGSNTIFCGGSYNASFFAGVFSGVYSFLLGKNVEASYGCKNCPKGCRIVLDSSLDYVYFPDLESLKLDFERSNVSLPKENFNFDRPSFSDLIKFGKVDFDDSGLSVKGEKIFSSEQEMFDLITRYYFDYGMKDFFEKTILGSSYSLASRVFLAKSKKENFQEMLNLLCAFGWGFPKYLLGEKEVFITFIHAPLSTNKPIYFYLVVNGFLNFIFGEKYSIKNISVDYKSKTSSCVYSRA